MTIVRKTLNEAEPLSKAEIARLKAIKDEDIDYSDIPELDETFWKNAKLVMPQSKKQITIRFDQEILDWFKAQGKGYQSKMNAVLRAYVEAHREG